MKQLNGALLSVTLLLGAAIGVALGRPVTAAPKASEVEVINTPLAVADVNTRVPQPFRATGSTNFPALNTQFLLTTVPAGKRLVVEDISWQASATIGNQTVFAALRSGQLGPVVSRIQINPPHASLSPLLTIQDGAQPARLYFEAGEEVYVTVSATVNGALFQVFVNGYLIDVN